MSPLDVQYLLRMLHGQYTTPQDFGQMMAQSGLGMPGAPSPSFNVFNQGQQALHNFLVANPGFLAGLAPGSAALAGFTPGGNRITRGTPPTSPQ